MPASSLDEQLDKYLTDVHSIEQQALAQLKTAPKIAGDPELAAVFCGHLEGYAFEHLEIGAYELLRWVAGTAGDRETTHAAEKILAEERRAAKRIRSLFDSALEASLQRVGGVSA